MISASLCVFFVVLCGIAKNSVSQSYWGPITLVMLSCHSSPPPPSTPSVLSTLPSPQLFIGDSVTAYRDPAVIYHSDTFYLFFTMVEIEENDIIYSYTVQTQSPDLVNWTPLKKITPQHQHLNYCSPGNVVFFQGEWCCVCKLILALTIHVNKCLDMEIKRLGFT